MLTKIKFSPLLLLFCFISILAPIASRTEQSGEVFKPTAAKLFEFEPEGLLSKTSLKRGLHRVNPLRLLKKVLIGNFNKFGHRIGRASKYLWQRKKRVLASLAVIAAATTTGTVLLKDSLGRKDLPTAGSDVVPAAVPVSLVDQNLVVPETPVPAPVTPRSSADQTASVAPAGTAVPATPRRSEDRGSVASSTPNDTLAGPGVGAEVQTDSESAVPSVQVASGQVGQGAVSPINASKPINSPAKKNREAGTPKEPETQGFVAGFRTPPPLFNVRQGTVTTTSRVSRRLSLNSSAERVSVASQKPADINVFLPLLSAFRSFKKNPEQVQAFIDLFNRLADGQKTWIITQATGSKKKAGEAELNFNRDNSWALYALAVALKKSGEKLVEPNFLNTNKEALRDQIKNLTAIKPQTTT